jgi:hypothetical protein
MIKFFRNIRKKLISENRSVIRNTNYFKYALGEIVLVVVGILIALQINNWNEKRKEDKVLKEYLHKISENVIQDIEQINALKIRRDTIWSLANRSGQALLKNDFSTIQDIVPGQYVFFEFYFIPNMSGFDALKNSSFLGKINNTKVDSLLTLYYRTVETTHQSELSLNNFIENMEANLSSNVDVTAWEIIFHKYRKGETPSLNEYRDMLPYIQHNAFKVAVYRVMDSISYRRNYAALVETGNALIQEINKFCENDN